MKSFKSIRNRIDSIGKTKQITKSMRLVSYAKAQKNRVLYDQTESYSIANRSLIDMISTHEESKKSIYFHSKQEKSAIIAISTDRGLCSGYNTRIAKETMEQIKRKSNPLVITVGNKIVESLSRENIKIDTKFIGFSESPIYEEAKLIADVVIEYYRQQKIDEVIIIYTEFNSMIEQHTVSQTLLPYETKNTEKKRNQWSCDSGYQALLDKIVPDYLTSRIYRAVVEAALSEQSIRVSSMDAASKNSDEMIETLTLKYNQARQSSITSEITEIINGSNAVD